MKFSIFFLSILALASCGGDTPKDVIIKSLHTDKVCKESNFRFCLLAVDSTDVIQPVHKMDGLIFSFPKNN